MTISFTVNGTPKAQPRPRRSARGGVYTPKTAEAWKTLVKLQGRLVAPAQPLDGPLCLTVVFRMPRPKAHFRKSGELRSGAPTWHTAKPDVDNLTKAVMDALTGVLWRDDKQVSRTFITKVLSASPGAYILLETLH